MLLFHQDSFERISFLGEKKSQQKLLFCWLCSYFLNISPPIFSLLIFSLLVWYLLLFESRFLQVYEWLNHLLGNSNRKQAECEMVFSRFGKSLELHPAFWDLTNKLIDDWNHFSFDHFLFLYCVTSGGNWAKPNVSTTSKNVKFGSDAKGNVR